MRGTDSKWKKKKERAYNIKLPLALEEGVATGTATIRDFVDYDGSADKLPTKKKKKKKLHNPWGEDATANPENMSAGSGG